MTLQAAREHALAGRWDDAAAVLGTDDLERVGEWWEALGDELGEVEAYRRSHAAFVGVRVVGDVRGRGQRADGRRRPCGGEDARLRG